MLKLSSILTIKSTKFCVSIVILDDLGFKTISVHIKYRRKKGFNFYPLPRSPARTVRIHQAINRATRTIRLIQTNPRAERKSMMPLTMSAWIGGRSKNEGIDKPHNSHAEKEFVIVVASQDPHCRVEQLLTLLLNCLCRWLLRCWCLWTHLVSPPLCVYR